MGVFLRRNRQTGRRLGRRVDGELERRFLFLDLIQPVAELDADGGVSSLYVYGSRAHVPDYMVRAGSTYRLVTDHLGSVRLVVDTATGTVVQRIDYDAFGRVELDTAPGFQPFGFAGGLYDPDTGLVRFGARDYDPKTGRWTAPDPLLFAAGDPNLYVYAGNDPVNRIVPTGRKAQNQRSGSKTAEQVADLLGNFLPTGPSFPDIPIPKPIDVPGLPDSIPNPLNMMSPWDLAQQAVIETMEIWDLVNETLSEFSDRFTNPCR